MALASIECARHVFNYYVYSQGVRCSQFPLFLYHCLLGHTLHCSTAFSADVTVFVMHVRRAWLFLRSGVLELVFRARSWFIARLFAQSHSSECPLFNGTEQVMMTKSKNGAVALVLVQSFSCGRYCQEVAKILMNHRRA